MNYIVTKIKTGGYCFLKLFILLLCIVNISAIHGMKPKAIPHEEMLKSTLQQIYPTIQKMRPDALYAIFSDSKSEQFQALAKATQYVSTQFSMKNILNITGNELYKEKFKQDFILLANTKTGNALLTRILCNIFTKSERTGTISAINLTFIKQACKSVVVQQGEYGREYEWEDGKNLSVLEGALRYTPGVEIKLPV